jgi:hypothetical protein
MSQVRDNFDQRHGTGEFQIVTARSMKQGGSSPPARPSPRNWRRSEHMQRGQNTVEPIMPKEQAAAHANTREFLNPAQRRAIEEVLTSHDRVHGLQGLAGTQARPPP